MPYSDPEKQRAFGRKWAKERRAFIQSFKEVPCTDCGIQYPPWVMQFDHLRDKKFKLNRPQSMTVQDILDEIEKCEVVCANCHAQRTHDRGLLPQSAEGADLKPA